MEWKEHVVMRSAWIAWALLLVAACGDDDAPKPAAKAGAVSAQALASAPAAATPGKEAGAPPAPTKPAACSTGGLEALSRCVATCAAEEDDRESYLAAARQKAAVSPFRVEVARVYFKGACYEGPDPAKRRDAAGIAAVVDGSMTYGGDDLIAQAALDGALLLRLPNGRLVEAPAATSDYRRKDSSSFLRRVRGSDPWAKGETRQFHFESLPLSPAYCEIQPKESEVYLEIAQESVLAGRQVTPVKFVGLAFDEVLGMAVDQQVSVVVAGGDKAVAEPANGHFSKLDRMLVTRLSGKTEWIRRSIIALAEAPRKGPGATFPSEISSNLWRFRANRMSEAWELGGFAPKGEDEQLVVVDLQISPLAGSEAEPPSLKGLEVRLETAPDSWRKPVADAAGQIDFASTVPVGGSVSGKLVFVRQRFERPFRLEIKTPDRATLYLNVFTYDTDPSRRHPTQ